MSFFTPSHRESVFGDLSGPIALTGDFIEDEVDWEGEDGLVEDGDFPFVVWKIFEDACDQGWVVG